MNAKIGEINKKTLRFYYLKKTLSSYSQMLVFKA